MAAALLAGCGGSQPPIGASATMQQRPAIAAARTIVRRIQPMWSYAVLYSFSGCRASDGAGPDAGLTDVNDTLYGTTYGGGANCHRDGWGTVYSISTDGDEKVLHTFRRDSAGNQPVAGLTNVNGILYGVTAHGRGKHNYGTVYSISTTGKDKFLFSFDRSDGDDPQGSLTAVNGRLYGTTLDGGSANQGTVFSMTMDGKSQTILHSFTGGSDGTSPTSGLINVNGTLYGTTYSGGGTGCDIQGGCGTVYRISTSGKERVIHRFGGSDGADPRAGLIEVNGTLYGTTLGGGNTSCGCGTVYRISTSGKERVIYSFGYGSGGANPGPLLNVNGTLYGTTNFGGSGCGNLGCGTVYSVTTSGVEKVLHRFKGSKLGYGPHPEGRLIEVHGTLYGTTQYGGSECGEEGCGTVFTLKE
ncbi:MAG: choice-of-anchor tandem repeat GloVer-containing protein [Candidatus Cybelea sp.]